MQSKKVNCLFNGKDYLSCSREDYESNMKLIWSATLFIIFGKLFFVGAYNERVKMDSNVMFERFGNSSMFSSFQ